MPSPEGNPYSSRLVYEYLELHTKAKKALPDMNKYTSIQQAASRTRILQQSILRMCTNSGWSEPDIIRLVRGRETSSTMSAPPELGTKEDVGWRRF